MAAVFRPSIIKHLMRLASRPAAAYSEIDFIDFDPDNIVQVVQILNDDSATTSLVGIGTGSFTATAAGGVTRIYTTEGTFLSYTSGSTSGNPAGFGNGDLTARGQLQSQPVLRVKTRTAADITSQRIWVGFFTAGTTVATLNTDTPGTAGVHGAAFRYSTVAGDTNWQAVTANAVTQTVTNTGVAVVASTRYRFRIDVFDTTSFKFYINDVLVATVTGTLPSLTTGMQVTVVLLTQTGAGRTFSISRWHLRHQQP